MQARSRSRVDVARRAALLAAVLLLACAEEEAPLREGIAYDNCFDLADNDGDGIVDCDDEGCWYDELCGHESEEDECAGETFGEVCDDGDIWLYECGERVYDDPLELCTYGCEDEYGGPVCCELSSYRYCSGDDIVLVDTCGVVQEVVDTCGDGEVCYGGACHADECTVTFHYSLGCSDVEGVWIYFDGGLSYVEDGHEWTRGGFTDSHTLECAGHVRTGRGNWGHSEDNGYIFEEITCSGGEADVYHPCYDETNW